MALIDDFRAFLANCKALFAPKSEISAINEKIPNQASAQNQLADKAFVNSTVQTGTANFRGSWACQFELPIFTNGYPLDYARNRKPTPNDYMVIRDAGIWLGTDPSDVLVGICYLDGNDIRVIDAEEYGGILESHKIARMGNYEDVPADEVVDDMTATKDYVYPYQGKYYARLIDQEGEEVFDITDTTKWCEIKDGAYPEERMHGTWRFKYTGNWDVLGNIGWLPEYQVNEEPLTAAQIAALNSNITESLTNKLVALPSKPVDTVAQVLTDLQKSQARTNIGATAQEVFVATYGTTTASEIQTAIAAGKLVVCVNSLNSRAMLIGYDEVSIQFSRLPSSGRQEIWRCSISNSAWLTIVTSMTTSWQSTPDNTHYPSEKLVKDSLDAKQPLIDSTHKLDYSFLDNTPTIPAAQVQSDWNQSDNTQVDFIKNKPTIPAAPVTMTGATASAAGSAGYAPAPAAGDEGKYLRGDGTWQEAGGGSDAALDKIVEGQAGIPEFDATETYLAGHYVLYNEYVWRFTQNHNPGAWTGNDAVQTSVINELEGLLIGDTEVVNVVISSSDDQLTVSGITVSLTFDDGSPTVTATTNASGLAGFNVAKGKVYNVIVPSQTGYQTPSPVKVLANSNERYVNVVYSVAYSGVATVTVTFSVYNLASITEFVGKNASIVLSNNDSITAAIDSNGVATFTNVPQGLSGFVTTPYIAGYANPSRINFNVNSSSVGLNAVYHIQVAGIYMALNDGTEVAFDSFDAQTDTCVALHIATADLLAAGCDYYVPIEEFTAAWFVNSHRKRWSDVNVVYPNVPEVSASYYDGKTSTSLMLSDAYNNGTRSPIAEAATLLSLTINGNVMHGFIGTNTQLQVMVNNYNAINGMVTASGYAPAWYDKFLWTSSQANVNNKAIREYNGNNTWNQNPNNMTQWNCYYMPFFSL